MNPIIWIRLRGSGNVLRFIAPTVSKCIENAEEYFDIERDDDGLVWADVWPACDLDWDRLDVALADSFIQGCAL